MRRYGVWLAILLLIAYAQFVGGGWSGIYTSSIRLTTLALLGVVFATLAVAAWRDRTWRPRSTLTPVILAALGSLALSTVVSRQPRVSAEYLAWAIVLAGLYLLLVRLLRDPFLGRRVAGLSIVLGLVPALALLGAIVLRWTEWWGLVGRLTFPPLRPAFESFLYGNPSSVLAVVVLFLPSSLAVIAGPGRARAALAAALLAIAAAVALLSGSRAGWLAIAVSLLVLIVAVAAHPGTRRSLIARGRGVLSASGGRAFLATILVIGLAGVVTLGPGVVRRTLEGGDSIRGGFVMAAFRMFAEAPIAGTGPGTWVAQRIEYTRAPEIDYYIPHAHNVYAQTLAELGIVGAVVGVLLAAWVIRLITRAIRGEDADRRRWGWAALAGVTYFAAHSTLDLFMNMPAILFALALPIAWLDATSPGPMSRAGAGAAAAAAAGAVPPEVVAPTGNRRRTIGWAAGAVGLTLALALLVRLETPAFQNQQAVDAANRGDWSGALDPARSAVVGDPDMPAFRMTLGLALAQTGDHEAAAAEFRRVAESDDLPEAWLNLAAELTAIGDADLTDEALDALWSALRLGYQRAAITMSAGELALRLGDVDLARGAFGAALATVPTLAADPWWAGSPDRAAMFRAAVREAILQASPSIAWEIALLSGDPDGATILAIHAGDPAMATVAIKAWSGDRGATDAMFARCAASPLELGALTWCGRLAGRVDQAESVRYRLWAGYIVGGAEDTGALVHVATTQRSGRWTVGGTAEFWGHYTYRQPTPWDLLGPTLLHLTAG